MASFAHAVLGKDQQLPDNLPGCCFGRYLTDLLKRWDEGMEIVSTDSTPLKTGGGVWHKKDRAENKIPHTTMGVTLELE
jgi:hypothetical protein